MAPASGFPPHPRPFHCLNPPPPPPPPICPMPLDRGPPEVDGEALVDEFRRAADALTMGMWNEMEAEAGEQPGPAGAAEVRQRPFTSCCQQTPFRHLSRLSYLNGSHRPVQ